MASRVSGYPTDGAARYHINSAAAGSREPHVEGKQLHCEL